MIKISAFLVAVVTCLANIGIIYGADNKSQQAARPLITLTGTDSHVKEACYHRIASEKEWINIWQRHKGVETTKNYDFFYDPLGIPSVDFEKCMIVAVFQGSGRNSAGLKAIQVLEDENDIVLEYVSKGYQTAGPGGGGKQVSVYGFFVLPRSSKVVVLREKLPLMNQPPVWKEQARLSP